MTLTKISSFGQNEENFQIPDLPDEYLDIEIIDNEESNVEEIPQSYPLAVSEATAVDILHAKKLTSGDVKEVYSLELSSNTSNFQPGDTIGILTKNREADVQKLFKHLGITNLVKKKCKVVEKTVKNAKNVAKPIFIGKITTLEHIFTFYLDIQCLPKKLLLRILANFTKDENERRYLLRLCSKEGADVYTKEVLEANKNFLDILLMFPTCSPPVARLIENLPQLLPRPYSIASSPLVSPNKIRIVFSVFKPQNGLTKEGLCTGMLKDIISKQEDCKVKMFLRKSNGFNLPDDDAPLILIGPGTGIAPFIGFLEHRRVQQLKGQIWLFYGCQYKAKDYLFEEELKEYLNVGVLTKLSVAFSRETDTEAKYVQDNLRKYGKDICHLIFEENANIYVCGDAKNMRKDVQNAFVEIFQTCNGMTAKQAQEAMKNLQKQKRYHQDIWL